VVVAVVVVVVIADPGSARHCSRLQPPAPGLSIKQEELTSERNDPVSKDDDHDSHHSQRYYAFTCVHFAFGFVEPRSTLVCVHAILGIYTVLFFVRYSIKRALILARAYRQF